MFLCTLVIDLNKLELKWIHTRLWVKIGKMPEFIIVFTDISIEIAQKGDRKYMVLLPDCHKFDGQKIRCILTSK